MTLQEAIGRVHKNFRLKEVLRPVSWKGSGMAYRISGGNCTLVGMPAQDGTEFYHMTASTYLLLGDWECRTEEEVLHERRVEDMPVPPRFMDRMFGGMTK